MQMQKEQVHLAADGVAPRLALKPHDRTRTAPKAKPKARAPRTSGSIASPFRLVRIFSSMFGHLFANKPQPAQRKPVPVMVCSPAEEIAAHNATVHERGTFARGKLNAQRITRRKVKSLADTGQHPKFAKERTHKQHKHEQRDEFGAVTLVGSPYEMEGENLQPTTREHLFGGCVGPDGYTQYTARRIWLAGISAQRGY